MTTAAVTGSAGLPRAQAIGAPAARGAADPPSAETLVRCELVQVDAPEGGGIELAVVLTIEPGWHIYWQNPGDSGMAPTLKVTAPAGWTTGPARWPTPRRFQTPDETTFGYERRVALFVPMQPPAGSTGGAPVTVEVRWMVCKSICLTGAATREVTIAIDSAPPAPSAAVRRVIDESRGRLPRAAKGDQAAVEMAAGARSGSLRVALGADVAPAGHKAAFIPADTPGVTYGPVLVQDAATSPTAGKELLVPIEVDPGNALGQALRAAGLVVWMAADGATATEPAAIAVDVPIPTAPQRGGSGKAADGPPAEPAGPRGGAR